MIDKARKPGLFLYLLIAILLILTSFSLLTLYNKYADDDEQISSPFELRAVIIDAGHGGKDGGAISVTGTVEKELNLEIANNLEIIMKTLGYKVIMTRTTDCELTVEGSSESRKMQDLKGRLLISQSNKNIPFVSIHMNKFSDKRYSGLQVYYSKNNDLSKEIAVNIQNTVKSTLQPTNNRNPKAATSSIFLLSKITSPAVLIECGFLSNQNEAKLLDDAQYRRELSLVIASALSIDLVN